MSRLSYVIDAIKYIIKVKEPEKPLTEEEIKADVTIKELLKTEQGLLKICLSMENPVRDGIDNKAKDRYIRHKLAQGETLLGGVTSITEIPFRKELPNWGQLSQMKGLSRLFKNIKDEAVDFFVKEELDIINRRERSNMTVGNRIINIRQEVNILPSRNPAQLRDELVFYEVILI